MFLRNFLLTTASILIAAAIAGAHSAPTRIKVISEETHTYQAAPLTPPDCNWKDLSAYCYSSAPQSYVEHKLLVQDSEGRSLELTCTAGEQHSSCASLPVNQSFEARKKNNRLEVRYKDQHGKTHKQFYRIVGEH